MTLLSFSLSLYAFVMLLFLHRTLEEGGGPTGAWDAGRLKGLALSLTWPLALAAVLLVAYQERRSN
ncbi:hypothetical protein LXM94_05345 [Rhizobium sp. TRM95111]|uniref:hypothetical protein n=1 Tax=Rhizobium alarense TaxID=2846851 RepID=UPI001F1D7BEA|nr:hypothetical protein [Rhizobium alarense]MCF3639388.1 hypothetical protein [Rhizobium alarense]